LVWFGFVLFHYVLSVDGLVGLCVCLPPTTVVFLPEKHFGNIIFYSH